jgi:hypothetical protein
LYHPHRLRDVVAILQPNYLPEVAGHKDGTAETFVTAGTRCHRDRPACAVPNPRPNLREDAFLINFNVAFCMEAAQTMQNEALELRVTVHKARPLGALCAPTAATCTGPGNQPSRE